MENTHATHPTDSNHLRPSKSVWLGFSAILFICFIIVGVLVITLLNGGWVNHVRTPVATYFSLFPLFWMEEPFAALEFITTKSVILFSHHDERSDLNLWTLEYDAITLFVYITSALLSSWLITNHFTSAKKKLITPLFGIGILILSFTYMTALEHCAGATWVGFVSLYGLGVSGFDLYPYYQAVFAGIGLALLGWVMFQLRAAN